MIEVSANPTLTLAHVDLSVPELIDIAIKRNEVKKAANNAITANTGKRTGRSPQDRFIVKDEETESTVNWGAINQPFSPDKFNALWDRTVQYLKTRETFISHLQIGADDTYGLPITVITELAWHALFTKQLFIRTLSHQNSQKPNWTLISAPGFVTDPERDGTRGDGVVILNIKDRKVLLCGMEYAGEMKKAMFSVLNYILPAHNVLPMHCAANVGKQRDVALFFGLSGTGKTTLSADPERYLVGDDEHGWGDQGVFNFEGGCYAKCIDLSKEREPVIWDAIRYGAIMENVVLNPNTLQPDYSDGSLTQNTRAAYPREHIAMRVEENRAGQPQAILFLTCDLYGVLPAIARLTREQAAYYFLSGYTALVGSTEVGSTSTIKSTFSTCFGAPFFPRPPQVYAELLMKRAELANCDIYLVNTGWTGGAYGKGGQRFSIPTTRSVVNGILSGQLKNAEYQTLPGFNLAIPTSVPGLDSQLLDPRNSWQDKALYKEQANQLITQFIENFKKFDVSSPVQQAGPITID
jgi:phosphoenolpyruvate carboxykinase (ATP)